MQSPTETRIVELRLADRVRVQQVKLLSDNWYTLKTTRFDFLRSNGEWQEQNRETYDRGNGACILLYQRQRRRVMLTRQFRYPVFVNGWQQLMVEAVAGLLDEADPVSCIRAEAQQDKATRAARAAQDAQAAKAEREAAERAVRDNMAKLKALRLAREAAAPPPPVKTRKAATQSKPDENGDQASACETQDVGD